MVTLEEHEIITIQNKDCEGNNIITVSKEICAACVLTVTAGTNGMQGGDAGHGCRAVLKFKMSGGDMSAYVVKIPVDHTESVELIFGGDAELGCLIEGLKFAAAVLEEQACNNSLLINCTDDK